jgi:ribosomal protein S18 acetylase RimI-like enzyme
MSDPDSADITFRRPTEADHAAIVGRVDEWWGGRKVHALLPRLWFQHFTGTSWLAEERGGRPVGFLVGFISADRGEEAYVHMIGTSPNHRRVGLGRDLYQRFFDDARALGARRVTAITWPGNPISVKFHRALGFVPSEGPGSQNLYGTPAYADFDADGEDRVVFSREL